MRTLLLGKASAYVGFVLLLTAVAFSTSYHQWVASLSFVVGVFFLVVGWVAGTDQLGNTWLTDKIAATILSVSVMSLAIAVVSLFYSEIGSIVHEISVGPRAIYLSATGQSYSIDTGLWHNHQSFRPYGWVSFPLAIFGAFLLTCGLVLKFANSYRLVIPRICIGSNQRHLAYGFAPLLAGISFLLSCSIANGYINAYAQYMTGKLDVPSAYTSTLDCSMDVIPVESLSQHVDFLFTPWLDCRVSSKISTDSPTQVTLLVYSEHTRRPIFNCTSDEVRCSLTLPANSQYTFRIKSTLNQSVTVAMTTRIHNLTSQIAQPIGIILVAAGSTGTLVLAGIGLTRWDERPLDTSRVHNNDSH